MFRRRNLRCSLYSFALGGAILSGFVQPAQAEGNSPTQKPNIVVILADDMGYSDIGSFGGEISTPNLDKLAQGGVRFTQFYNTARCCPTRASLLTGLYPHEAGVGHMTTAQTDDQGNVLSGYSGHLNENCVTIAETLKSAGYFTAMAGKWHVGQNHGVTPTGRGFDRALHAAAGGFYFSNSPSARIFLNGERVEKDDPNVPKDWYSTDLWTDFGLKFVDEAKQAKKPFFLYVGENAPHFPLQAPAADIARWRGKFKQQGWDKLRAARYQRQLKLGIVDKKWPLSPRPSAVPAWSSLTPQQQDRYDQIMATYAAVVEHMDTAIGRLVDGLKARGELDNTLILFLSDNGGNAESGVNGRLEGEHPGDALSTVFVGQSWATLNNTPFTRYKHYTDEGGISTPLIAHWPAGIPKNRDGVLEKQPGHLVDIMATCVDLAGAKYPKQFNGHSIKPLEGVSLRPAFSGKPLQRKQPLYWEHEGNRAIRDGNWKLVALENQPWRLYDLSNDRTEQLDLASKQPAKVKELATKWNAYAARANVLPLGGWRGTGAKGGRGKGKNAKRNGALNQATRFNLKGTVQLGKAKSPNIPNQEITITAKFNAQGTSGVIVAQGGTGTGYSLYLDKGQLVFAVRIAGEIFKVTSLQTIVGAHSAKANLSSNGSLTLWLDEKQIATGKAPSAIVRMPTDGLDVGQDSNGLVSDYSADNKFAGTVESVQIELGAVATAETEVE